MNFETKIYQTRKFRKMSSFHEYHKLREVHNFSKFSLNS